MESTGVSGSTRAARDADRIDDRREARDQDRRHFDAAVQMVADGATRWVLVSGVTDVDDLMSRGTLARRLARIGVRAVGDDAVLVERREADEPAPADAPARRASVRRRLAAVTHAIASLGR